MEKIADFLGKIFNGISVEDSIAFLGISAITFLLASLIGAWSRSGKIKRLKKEAEAKDTELKNLKVQYDSVVADYEKKEAILKKSEAQISELNEDVSRITNERMHYKMELDSARQHLEQLQAENLEYATQGGKNSTDEELDDVNTQFEDDEKIDTSVYADRLALIEEKLEKLELENSNLRDEISTIETRGTTTSTSTGISSSSTPVVIPVGSGLGGSSVPSSSGASTTTPADDSILDLSKTNTSSNAYDEMPPEFEDEIRGEDEGDMSPQDRANRAKASIVAAIGTRIPSASLADKDDLKSIDGVGPFIEKKLNDIGIYTYEQISQLDADLIQHITDAIQFFPGRIQKDDWMGQARSLMG